MTESVKKDDYHGNDKPRRTRRKRQLLWPCQADQPGGGADSSCKPVCRERHRQKVVGRAPWQETMDISHEIGSTHN